MSVQERLGKMLKTEKKEEKLDQVGMIMAYEQGELSDTDTIKLFADLVKSGLAWKLQGHYGRTAKALMDGGYLDAKGKILKEEAEIEKEGKTNGDIIDLFVTNEFPKDKMKNWGNTNLRINKEPNGWALVNYATPILYRADGSKKVFFNKNKYSNTTTKIQKLMQKIAEKHGVDLIEVDEKGISNQIEKD